MREVLEHRTYDEERALYGSCGLLLRHCSFDGPADGESALKECRDIAVEDCRFNLRYPFWHVQGLNVVRSEFTPNCRAAFWYTEHASVQDSELHGIKAFRECRDISLSHCNIISPEFGWFSDGVRVDECEAESEYFMLRSRNLSFRHLSLRGKYSFQYIENAVLEHCVLHTKDTLWHCRNVVVRDCVLCGEYPAWYADSLTLERCKISGTQPFCYCTDLVLRDCEMTDTDLCFEKSHVDAVINTPVLSIKNPASGTIRVPHVGEIIMDEPGAKGRVVVVVPRRGDA